MMGWGLLCTKRFGNTKPSRVETQVEKENMYCSFNLSCGYSGEEQCGTLLLKFLFGVLFANVCFGDILIIVVGGYQVSQAFL